MGGGSGKRMDSDIPKQFITIDNIPVIAHTYNKLKSLRKTNFCIVLPEENFSYWRDYIRKYIDNDVKVVAGGSSRNFSVRKGIESIEEKIGLIAIHDGVRPFVTTKFVEKLFKEAEINGNAIPFTNSTNSLRKIEGNKNFSVDRSLYVQIQTPQVFRYNDIIKCFEKSTEDDYNDEASLIESFGQKINLVLGEEGNIKITNKEDLKYFN